MRISQPRSLDEALAILKEAPGTDVLAGGTDFMVKVNYNHRRPDAVLSLRHVGELRQWRRDGSSLVLGAGLRFADIIDTQLADLAPALAQAARRMPDVILLDYMLPNIDGIATLTAIRSLPDGRDARVVVITGGSIDQIAHRFRSLGVTTFLSKPVALDDLVETVRKLASE